jgi:ATP-dependent Clp protease protease subunit
MVSKVKLESVIQDIHENGVNYLTRDIYLHGNYKSNDDDDSYVDWKMAFQFIKNLHFLESISKDPILIHLLSAGGCWNSGMAILNSIQFSKCYITMICYGHAESMAAVILQGADLRLMMPDSFLMVHMGSFEMDGSSAAVKSAVEHNTKLCTRMIDIFAEKAYKTGNFQSLEDTKILIENEIKDKTDWYLEPQEAIEWGFCDGIIGDKGYESIEKLRSNK